MKNYLKFSFLFATIVLFSFSACVKTDPVAPPNDSKDSTVLTATNTIAQLKAMYSGSLMEITDSIILKATVSANDKSGNIYKTLFVQDATGGLELKLDATNLFNDYPAGTNIFISTKGMYLGDYNGAIQLGGMYNGAIGRLEQPLIPLHIFKAGDQSEVAVTNLKISDITDANIGTVIKLSGVQFDDTTSTYSDASKTSNRTLIDTLGNSILVRTSNYADFSSDKLPAGNGELTAVLSKFGSDYQLYIRTKEDVKLNNARWLGSTTSGNDLLNETFDTDLGAFSAFSITGDYTWKQSNYKTSTYAKMSGHDGTNNVDLANEDWLISSAIAVNKDVALSFKSAMKYGDPTDGSLKIFYSSNFDGTHVATATWTDITAKFTLSAGAWAWTESGSYTISGVNGNLFIAFKYTSTTSNAPTWELDDILVK